MQAYLIIFTLNSFLLYTGTEFKTTACPITGALHFMEIQRGKEGMKTKQFNSSVGATICCTLRTLLGMIPPQVNQEKHGIRGAAWFGSVKSANEVGLRGHEGVFQVKQNHALFPKEFIEKALKDVPGGVYIILEGTTKDEVPLVALGYRYSQKTTLFFVLTENSGTSQLGEPYHMKYTNSFGNVCISFGDHPQVISNLFVSSNTIDTHNQLCQDSLRLKKNGSHTILTFASQQLTLATM